jgi:hypothetical protein
MPIGTVKMLIFDTFEELEVTLVEWKSLYKAVDWKKIAIVHGYNDGSSRAAMLRWALNELRKGIRNKLRERPGSLESCLKSAAKTSAAASYVKLIALRGLQRMRVLLRQKLASSAPVERLILRNRPRQLFAARPPIAPPHFA